MSTDSYMYHSFLDTGDELEIIEQSKPGSVVMSEVWKNLPLDIQRIVIDFLAFEAFKGEDQEDEYDPVLRKSGVFPKTARAKSWNRLLAVGGHFRVEALRRLIRWDWWMFDKHTQFSMAIKSWDILSPYCSNQIRVLTLGLVRLDGSNCLDIINLCSEVSRFTNLTMFRVTFEVDQLIPDHVSRYFDHDEDLDEIHPELFEAIEAVRAPNALVCCLKNDQLSRYLESVITGHVQHVTRQPDTIPHWRRDPEQPWLQHWF